MKKKYLIIARKLINASFPMLRDKKIHIFIVRFRFYACSIWLPPFIRFIIMSTRTKNFNENVISGILAHELCHQERYLEKGMLYYLRFATGFIFSRKVRINEEKATDRLTIEKGYGRQLQELSLIQAHDINHERINDNYLSAEEIKSYAVSIGKW
jgi:hypothetical protein